MWLFNKNDDEKKLQKELHKMDKADEKLAKELKAKGFSTMIAKVTV